MQIRLRRAPLLLTALILWVLFVLCGYYYWHKPINLAMVIPALNAAIDIVFIVLFAGIAGGLGRALLRAEGPSALEFCAAQFALGAAVIAFAWLAVGLLGLYRLPLAVPLMLLALILLRRNIKSWYADLAQIQHFWRGAGSIEKTMALLTAALLLFQLLIALAPPLKWDALAYHLQLPRQYLDAGRFIFTPENPYWGHPQLVEMLYTFAFSFHRAETAAVLGWLAGFVFLVGLLGFTNTWAARWLGSAASPAAGWAAVTAVAAGQTFRLLLAWSYTDLFSALFGLAALTAFFAAVEGRRPNGFWLAALFAGLALGTKWTAGIVALGLVLGGILFGRRAGLALKHVLIAGLVVTAAVLPWLVKNWVYTGSPIYPYFLGTQCVDSARMASANQAPENVQWWLHAFAPVTTTWTGIDSAAGFSADIGPLLLLLAVPGFVRLWKDERVKTLVLILVLSLLAIAVGSLRFGHLMQTRLYYAALPALAAPAGWGWAWLQAQNVLGVRMRRIYGAVILLVMGLALWQDAYLTTFLSPLDVVLGTKTPEQYLDNALGSTRSAMQELAALPGSARILMLWEPRGLYAPPNAQADLWIDRWRTDRRELGTAPAILDRWQNEGFTHVLVYQRGVALIEPQAGRPASPDWIEYQALLDLLPPPETLGDQYLLYTLE